MRATIVNASGRARCMLCRELIVKDTEQTKVGGYRASGMLHTDSSICKYNLEQARIKKEQEKLNANRTIS